MDRSEFDIAYRELIQPGGFHEEEEYYGQSRERYWKTVRYLADIDLPAPANILEIGGGQIGLIAARMFGDHVVIADIDDTSRGPVEKSGLTFSKCNLLVDDPDEFKNRFDAVIMAEVIEHLPVPPYVVLSKIRSWLKDQGALLITTPNLFRLRNLARMLFGRDLFDRFMLPHPDRGLGHQTEYSADHLSWQAKEAGFDVTLVCHDQLGNVGHSVRARVARRLLSPLLLRRIWREEIVLVARKGTP